MDCPKISIIILNWNNWKDTIECIRSVRHINYPNYNLTLVDNGSTNDSVNQIKQHFHSEKKFNFFDVPFSDDFENNTIPGPELSNENFNGERIFLIEINKNLGFSEGNNRGIRFCIKNFNPDYVLLLNNDVIVDAEFLSDLVQAAEKNPDVGFCGPKIYYYDRNGRKDIISFTGASIDLIRGWFTIYGIDQLDEGQLDDQKRVDWLQGSCILVKKKVIEDTGILDPVYFFYWEDADWCIRGTKNNWSCLYAPAAKVWHKGGMASDCNESTFQIYYFARNRLIFMRKNSGRKMYTIFLLYYFGFDFWKQCVYHTLKGKSASLRTYLKATADGFTIKLSNT